ncbi:MAG: rod shape-determining protein MreC [Bacteroidaceae bacterium]|nr:rod shape-determining protein MreC [Bacteroidaceae bacterium]
MQTILNFLIKHNHWFLFALLEGISFVLIISFNNYQGAVMFTSANNVAGNIYSVITDVDSYFALKGDNEILKEYNRTLLEELEQAKNELKTLKEKSLLTVHPFTRNRDNGFFYKTATVVNNSLNKFDNYITIDKGTNDGVNSEMGVFSDKGIVGIVYQSSENYSIVIPLLNSKSNINCRVKGSNSFCALQWDGSDTRYSYLVDLPRYAAFENGDTVTTSGFSSIFPADIPVGRICSLEDSEDGLFYRAKVELFVDFSAVSNVFVVGNNGKYEQSKLEEETNKL